MWIVKDFPLSLSSWLLCWWCFVLYRLSDGDGDVYDDTEDDDDVDGLGNTEDDDDGDGDDTEDGDDDV